MLGDQRAEAVRHCRVAKSLHVLTDVDVFGAVDIIIEPSLERLLPLWLVTG